MQVPWIDLQAPQVKPVDYSLGVNQFSNSLQHAAQMQQQKEQEAASNLLQQKHLDIAQRDQERRQQEEDRRLRHDRARAITEANDLFSKGQPQAAHAKLAEYGLQATPDQVDAPAPPAPAQPQAPAQPMQPGAPTTLAGTMVAPQTQPQSRQSDPEAQFRSDPQPGLDSLMAASHAPPPAAPPQTMQQPQESEPPPAQFSDPIRHLYATGEMPTGEKPGPQQEVPGAPAQTQEDQMPHSPTFTVTSMEGEHYGKIDPNEFMRANYIQHNQQAQEFSDAYGPKYGHIAAHLARLGVEPEKIATGVQAMMEKDQALAQAHELAVSAQKDREEATRLSHEDRQAGFRNALTIAAGHDRQRAGKAAAKAVNGNGLSPKDQALENARGLGTVKSSMAAFDKEWDVPASIRAKSELEKTVSMMDKGPTGQAVGVEALIRGATGRSVTKYAQDYFLNRMGGTLDQWNSAIEKANSGQYGDPMVQNIVKATKGALDANKQHMADAHQAFVDQFYNDSQANFKRNIIPHESARFKGYGFQIAEDPEAMGVEQGSPAAPHKIQKTTKIVDAAAVKSAQDYLKTSPNGPDAAGAHAVLHHNGLE